MFGVDFFPDWVRGKCNFFELEQSDMTSFKDNSNNLRKKIPKSDFTKSELIQYYWQLLSLIKDPHLRANPNPKNFPEVPEVLLNPLKFDAFDIAVELHRSGSCPWFG
jgi:hypothetical protein